MRVSNSQFYVPLASMNKRKQKSYVKYSIWSSSRCACVKWIILAAAAASHCNQQKNQVQQPAAEAREKHSLSLNRYSSSYFGVVVGFRLILTQNTNQNQTHSYNHILYITELEGLMMMTEMMIHCASSRNACNEMIMMDGMCGLFKRVWFYVIEEWWWRWWWCDGMWWYINQTSNVIPAAEKQKESDSDKVWWPASLSYTLYFVWWCLSLTLISVWT